MGFERTVILIDPERERLGSVPHSVDGFKLRFTSRTSWKTKVSLPDGEVIADDAPVAWKDGWRFANKKFFQRVWFRNADEMEAHRKSRKPFIVAVAEENGQRAKTGVAGFKCFIGVFEVVSTGKVLSDRSIETRVLRRMRGDAE